MSQKMNIYSLGSLSSDWSVFTCIKYTLAITYSPKQRALLFTLFLCHVQTFLSPTLTAEIWRATQDRGERAALGSLCSEAALGRVTQRLASVKEGPASLSSSTG